MIDLFTFSILLSVMLLCGLWRSSKIKSTNAYLFANRQTKWLALTATLVMTEFNSATLIAFSSLGYAVGLWALILPSVFLFGLLFYGMTVAKKWKNYNGTSVAGFFSERYGKKLGTLTSGLLLLSMVGFSAIYIKSLALLFSPLAPHFSLWTISGLLVFIILVMCLRGGLISIIRTDLLTFFFMLIFFPALVLFMSRGTQIIPIEQAHFTLPLRFVISLIVLTMFTYILAPWYGQKIFAAQSSRVAFWSVVVAALIVFLLYGCAIFATACFRYRGLTCDHGELALPSLIHQCLPNGMKGIAYALLFATSATTLTGVWNAMSSMWVHDFLSKSKSLKNSMLTTISLALLTYLLANTLVDKVFDKMILANIPVAALSFALLGGFYWKRATPFGAYLSIIVGCLWGVGTYLFYGEAGGYTWYWVLYGIPLIFISGIFGSLLSPRKVPVFQN